MRCYATVECFRLLSTYAALTTRAERILRKGLYLVTPGCVPDVFGRGHRRKGQAVVHQQSPLQRVSSVHDFVMLASGMRDQ